MHAIVTSYGQQLLIVQAFGAHEEEEGDDGHGHGEEEGHGHDQTTIWRGCCVLAGILVFYMFEVMLGLLKRSLVRHQIVNV